MIDLPAIRQRQATPVLCDHCSREPVTHVGRRFGTLIHLRICRRCVETYNWLDLAVIMEHQTPERADIAALLAHVDELALTLANERGDLDDLRWRYRRWHDESGSMKATYCRDYNKAAGEYMAKKLRRAQKADEAAKAIGSDGQNLNETKEAKP